MAKVAGADVPTRTSAHKVSLGHDIDDIVRKLVHVLGVKIVGAIVKKDVRTIQRWQGRKSTVNMNDERLLRDAFQIYSILAEQDGDHTIRAWFMGMNPTLDDRSPIELLIEGRARHVVAAARSFASGG